MIDASGDLQFQLDDGSVQSVGEVAVGSRSSPVLLRRQIGRRLHAARNHARLGLEDAAAQLDCSASTLSRLENGQTRVDVHIVRSMMDIYDVRDDDLIDMVRRSRQPGWWKQYNISDHDFVALETGARLISTFQPTFVPGLLQTADYARTLFDSNRVRRDEEWSDHQLAVRLIRQERLTDDEDPLHVDAVIDEFVLRKPVGGAAVMATQLEHLALVTELPTVTLRVVPVEVTANVAMNGGFTVVDFLDPIQPSMVHLVHALGYERKDKEEPVNTARLRFQQIRSLALSPSDSATLIERTAQELWSSRE